MVWFQDIYEALFLKKDSVIIGTHAHLVLNIRIGTVFGKNFTDFYAVGTNSQNIVKKVTVKV